MNKELLLTGQERFFSEDELIVTKTDLKGRITYANEVFLNIAGYGEQEILGKPHNIVRHPDMPRCVFKLLWDAIAAGREIFAYVVNRAKNGDHYWVFAHVTPSFDSSGEVIGYHSNRRVPNRATIDGTIVPLYRTLIDLERSQADRKAGMEASMKAVKDFLMIEGKSYDEWVFSI